jgi:hypothetical protein
MHHLITTQSSSATLSRVWKPPIPRCVPSLDRRRSGKDLSPMRRPVLCAAKDETSVDIVCRRFYCIFMRGTFVYLQCGYSIRYCKYLERLRPSKQGGEGGDIRTGLLRMRRKSVRLSRCVLVIFRAKFRDPEEYGSIDIYKGPPIRDTGLDRDQTSKNVSPTM